MNIHLIKSKYNPIGQTWRNAVNFNNLNQSPFVNPISGINNYQQPPDVYNPNNTNNLNLPTGWTPNSTVPPIQTTTVFNGKTFSYFTADDVRNQQTEIVTGGVWSDGSAQLISYYTSSGQTVSQKQYYVDVYNLDPTGSEAVSQFSIAYGHALGSGSDSQGQLNDSPSRAIYSQYRQLLLPTGTTRFETQGSGSTDSIYIINFKRNRVKERLDVGNFEIPLQTVSARANANASASGAITVAGAIYTVIDDSSLVTNPTVGEFGRVYNLVSGSIATGVYSSTSPVYYGKVYPDYGCIILDGRVLDNKLGFKTNVSSSSSGNNHFTLFRSISGSCTQINPSTSDKYGFIARNSEKITSTHYFVRVKNGEYNYSNNPSYITGSTGDIAQTTFHKDPITYITTVGLYNDHNELLAVAKVSKPILKSFNRETLIRVKLDF